MYQTILLIQDDSTAELAVRTALAGWEGDQFHIICLRSCVAALEWLASDAGRSATQDDCHLAIVVDLSQPDSPGLETFTQVHRAVPRIPILVLCRRQDEAVARTAVQNGAQDYLLRERLDSDQLGRALANMIRRAAADEARYQRDAEARRTLDSIGDAVVSTDVHGCVTYLNGVAERMLGWTLAEANGRPVDEVLRLIDADSRVAVPNPMAQAVREGRTVALTGNCLLSRRDGSEVFVEDSSAPIRGPGGQVSGAVMTFHDVSAARAHSRHMSFLAQHDSLTDLPNRILLQDRLTQALTLTQRHPECAVALLFVDLDGFKAINDSLGHAIGDLLLKSVARRLLGCVRTTDTVSRFGGDEFVILLPELTHASDTTLIAEKVLRSLRAPHRILHHSMCVTASIGIASVPEGETDFRLLINNADQAMYHAKASGRNNYKFFESALHTHSSGRRATHRRQAKSA